ncbi:MAG: hypothetical protein R2880_05800 [Deinococcales bacterium]
MRILKLESFSRTSNTLAYRASLDGWVFNSSFDYNSVDFLALEESFGPAVMERIYFHIVAFDINRLVSLKPDVIDFGIFQPWADDNFIKLWQSIIRGVWAQWRYENNEPHYFGP